MPLPDDYQLDITSSHIPVVPTGEYAVRISDIEDRGEEEFMGVARKRLRFWFEILEGKYKGIKLIKIVSNKWAPGGRYQPSHIYQITEAVINAHPTAPVKPNDLIGEKLRVTVNKITRDNQEFSQIVAFLPYET